MNKTMKMLIEEFIEGKTEGTSGTLSKPGNLKIVGNQLIHYWTPILERVNNKYILNMTRYSIQTGRIQKTIKQVIPAESLMVVTRVQENYVGSLVDYVKSEKKE